MESFSLFLEDIKFRRLQFALTENDRMGRRASLWSVDLARLRTESGMPLSPLAVTTFSVLQ